jgi:hypothetical protein
MRLAPKTPRLPPRLTTLRSYGAIRRTRDGGTFSITGKLLRGAASATNVPCDRADYGGSAPRRTSSSIRSDLIFGNDSTREAFAGRRLPRWRGPAAWPNADELDFYVNTVGIPPLDVLRWATRNGAQLMHRGHEMGKVRPACSPTCSSWTATHSRTSRFFRTRRISSRS